VAGGGNGGGAFEGLAATAMRFFGNGGSLLAKTTAPPAVEAGASKPSSRDKDRDKDAQKS
jgi:hypothetical protein